MKTLRLLAAASIPALTFQAAAQTVEPLRDYSINLTANASRVWYDDATASNGLIVYGSFLFLNEHFHLGPTMAFSRGYSEYFQTTSWGLGIRGKWTYENLQTADRTPFVEVSGSFNGSKGSDWKDATSTTGISVGYETFLNPYVSLAPSIVYSKAWTTSKDTSDDAYRAEYTSAQATAQLQLGLNVYL